MIWFTSDTHFGHKNIAGPKVSNWSGGYRDFNSVHEMNTALMNGINNHVEEGDTLYHLGDFSFHGGHPKTYRSQIVCGEVHLIMGNHDRERNVRNAGFSSVTNYKEISYEKIRLCLFHYALRVWNGHHRGSIALYGHSHNSINNHYGKSMDVGVDAIYALKGEYRPISIEEVMKEVGKREKQKIDHHE